MQSVIKIGSRESQLAVRQAEIIRDQIISCDPGITVIKYWIRASKRSAARDCS